MAGEVVGGEGPPSIEVVNVRQVGEQDQECCARDVGLNGAVRHAPDLLGKRTI